MPVARRRWRFSPSPASPAGIVYFARSIVLRWVNLVGDAVIALLQYWYGDKGPCRADFIAQFFPQIKHPENEANLICTSATAMPPSPTAAAQRFTEPERTSPAAKIPGRLVSSGPGKRLMPFHAGASTTA